MVIVGNKDPVGKVKASGHVHHSSNACTVYGTVKYLHRLWFKLCDGSCLISNLSTCSIRFHTSRQTSRL